MFSYSHTIVKNLDEAGKNILTWTKINFKKELLFYDLLIPY